MPTVKQSVLKQSPAKPVTFSRQLTRQRKGNPEWKFKIKYFKQVREYVDSETLVLCDLDNTVHQPKQLVGKDQWFEAHLEREKKKNGNFQQALLVTLDAYDRVHEISDVLPVEEDSPDIISLMQNETDVLAVTARGGNLAAATIRQLNSINIDFNKGRFKDQNFDLLARHALGHRKSLSQSGIVFCNGKDKGECTEAYLNKIGYRPKKIVCIEDKEENLAKLKVMADRLGIPFIGLHYTYLEDHLEVNEEHLERADIQLHYALNGSILSDEHAHVIHQYEKAKGAKRARLSLNS